MNRDEKFVHLHVHTEYSLLDGLSQIDRLVGRAKDLDMSSLAITDHGVMFGVIDFFRACQNHDIKPIIGMEGYLAPRSMEDRDAKLDKRAFHMLLLAKNQTGYANLMKLASEAQLRGYYYNPRIDRDLLEKYAEGLVATTGCLAAQVPQAIMNGHDDDARELIGWYQEVFGAENFYLELQYHNIDELELVNRWLAEYRQSGHTPVQWVATNDVHYVLDSDHDPHDTLLCIQTGNIKTESNRMRMSDASYHLKSHEEMVQALETHYSWLPEEMRFEAILNTAKIADRCTVDLNTKGYHLPRFAVPEGYDEVSYLRYLVDKGRYWRYGERADDEIYIKRMEHELSIIHTMGFDTYFLIVWDLCEFARHADIWWNVRGSGAGSMVAYCLGITNLDPIQNSLIFERFLNPGRNTMPDIDLDYPDDRRNAMIEYTAQKYGSDKVASIITFGTMGAKAAIRDVGRALNVPLSDVNQVVSLIPTEAKQKKIETYVESNPELSQLVRNRPELKRVVDTAKVLQGVSRHASTHAAGVIVADRPLVEYIPLHRLTRGADEDSALQQVTQFPMETCESLGLLKVDFLGLSTLTIMRRASDLIHRHHGKRWTMDNIPYRPHEGDDLTEEQQRENEMLKQAFVMLGEGHTIGVFQVESGGMQQMLRGMRPWKYEHIIAGISLYRPGPMDYIPEYNDRMHGRKEVTYLHDKLKPILGETYGIITYQEQIMQVASELFGYAMGEADLMRRAVSKKKEKELVKHKQIFIDRGPENGVSQEVAEAIFADIEFFANYGFNKSHAADYAMVTVQTAFLKCHYAAEYMAALLSVYREDTDRVATFLEECGRLDIAVLPPDVNHSEKDFDIQTDEGRRGIRFGMAAIKNAGVGQVQLIIKAREDGGAFTSLTDFCERVDLRHVGKRTLESLIKVGALDRFDDNRNRLLQGIDQMVSFSVNHHQAKEAGQMSLFGGDTTDSQETLRLPTTDAPDHKEMLKWERELLGFYITDHPVDDIMRKVDLNAVNRSDEIKAFDAYYQDRGVAMVGLIAGIREVTTKKGDMMAILSMEDRYGTVSAVMFPRTWENYKQVVRANQDSVVLVKGKADVKRGEPQILVDVVTTEFPVFAKNTEGEATNGYHTPPPNDFSGEEPPPRDYSDYQDAPAPVAVPVARQEVINERRATGGESIAAAEPMTANGHEHNAMEDQPERQWLIITFERTYEPRDEKRFNRIYHECIEYPGTDQFSVLTEVDGKPHRIDFVEDAIGVCDELVHKLWEIPGVIDVEIRPQNLT